MTYSTRTIRIASLASAVVLALAARAGAAYVKARVTIGDKTRTVFLAGREGDTVRIARSPQSQVTVSQKVADITAVRVEVEIDRENYEKVRKEGDLLNAARYLHNALVPHLDYLDLPDNNATGLALQAAVYYMDAAFRESTVGLDPEGVKTMAREIAAAGGLCRKVEAAAWFPHAEYAKYRALLCLLLLGKHEEVARELELASVPDVEDEAYAMFWLTRTYSAYLAEDYPKAMDCSTQALLFETKDLYVFPYALLMNAMCYEKLENWHRARDVYFEVGRLFRGTPPATVALRRVTDIMKTGHTVREEPKRIEQIFFGNQDDMQERVGKYLSTVSDFDPEKDIPDAPPQTEKPDEKNEETGGDAVKDSEADAEQEQPTAPPDDREKPAA